MSVLIDLVGAILFPHLSFLGADDGSVDGYWIPTWSSWPACVLGLLHPIRVSCVDRILGARALIVVEVSSSAHVTSIDLEVFFDGMRELDLDFLSCVVAVCGIAEVVCFSTSEVVHAVHIVNCLDFLLEKVFVVSKHIPNVHRESNSGNRDRFVWLSLKDLHIGILGLWDVVEVFDASIWVVIDKILSILVLGSIIFAKWSLVGTKSNVWTTIVGIDDIDSGDT